MQTFQVWARNNGKIPNAATTNAQIATSIVEYLKSTVQEAAFWARTAGNNLQTNVQNGLNVTFNARPAIVAPLPPAGPARQAYLTGHQNWAVNLLPAINLYVTNFQAQHANALAQEVTQRSNAHRLASATAAIPSPTDYFHGVNYDDGLERARVIGYIDYVIAAITAYGTTAVPHSNEMNRRVELVKAQLGRCKAETFLGADSTLCDFTIFNKAVPQAVRGEDIKEVAEYWSTERQATAARIQEVQAWANIQGHGDGAEKLRRYGSTGEAGDIRARKGFYQARGFSFERYKWFVDLGVRNATTSVSDSDRSFWVHLKAGALDALRGLQREYVADNQPAVTFKPNMGGEVGCFGIHEDVLSQFNKKLIEKIVIWNQQTRREDGAAVVPA
ncbi:MAG TPA: hypothetical protein VGX94_09725 [Terriglobia bacterium]|nr:hypothetical protein [Terriglobia bacterium]